VSPNRTRRGVLLAGVALVGLAGCSSGNGTDSSEDAGSEGSSGADESATETQGRDTTTTAGADDTDVTDRDTDTTATGTETDADGGLDLREANVVGVEFDRQGSRYTFDVTLHHDDGGEDGYANWWQVERLAGSRVGRRKLLHPHSNQPFTRSDSFEIVEARCVVVRGHDQTHGYGGRAMLVNLETGATRAVDQGSEPQSFSESDCP